MNHPQRLKKPPGGHRHFAFAIIGKTIYIGWNNSKTRPQLLHIKKSGVAVACHHAEAHAIYKVPYSKRKDAKIYVMRIRKNGNLALSKPCSNCIRLLKEYKIKPRNIWYTDKHGKWTNLHENKTV